MTDTACNFIWYDLFTTAPTEAIDFYCHVLGWTSRTMGADGNYTLFLSNQGPVAGTEQLPEPARQKGARPSWIGNVQVNDVDASVDEVRRLGGTVRLEPFDHPGVGRLAVIADPHGASLHLFAPSQSMPPRDASKHGQVVWRELLSADHERAFDFYSQLFGWTKAAEHDMGPMGKYLLFGDGMDRIGGMFTKGKNVPRSTWLFYVQVDDLDAAIERAKTKQGTVCHGPMEVPGGARIVQLADPQGAMIALHEMPEGAHAVAS